MQKQAVMIGGSVAGLASAVALARSGWRVDVIERDVAPQTNDGDAAFSEWERPGVPQFRQPHAFSARSRNLLMARIPEVVEWLLEDGIEEWNLFKMLAPQDLWSESDDEFTGLWSRRPAFELAVRRIAEREPGVELHCPAAAAGLVYGSIDSATPTVTGVRLTDGRELRADIVFDCAGRRTPVPRWLNEDFGITVPEDELDCDTVYYTRYYRQAESSGLSQLLLFGLQGQIERLQFLAFPGDHRTFGLALLASPGDAELRVLRHNWAFDAVVASVPAFAMWADPSNATPLCDAQLMMGNTNIRRHYVVDGKPIVRGLLPVGDSLCTTNPQYGWGASMALTYAFAAVDSVLARDGDLEATAVAFENAIAEEADSVYAESAAMDRLRIYEWRGEEVPDWDREAIERQRLILEGLIPGALRDPVLGRTMLRRTNLLDLPTTSLDDPDVVEHAKNTQRILASKPPRVLGPTREELRVILAAAEPALV